MLKNVERFWLAKGWVMLRRHASSGTMKKQEYFWLAGIASLMYCCRRAAQRDVPNPVISMAALIAHACRQYPKSGNIQLDDVIMGTQDRAFLLEKVHQPT
jgi:hypothetical protein